MRSDADTVDGYIAAVPAGRREALDLLRRLCREELLGYREAMMYGMPAYLRGDAVEVSFANQKDYVSLYILRRRAIDACAERLAGLSVGKGCIRFRGTERIDPAVVRDLLRATVADTGSVC